MRRRRYGTALLTTIAATAILGRFEGGPSEPDLPALSADGSGRDARVAGAPASRLATCADCLTIDVAGPSLEVRLV